MSSIAVLDAQEKVRRELGFAHECHNSEWIGDCDIATNLLEECVNYIRMRANEERKTAQELEEETLPNALGNLLDKVADELRASLQNE